MGIINGAVPTVASGASYPSTTYNTYVAGYLNTLQAAWTGWTPTVASGLTVGNGTWTGAYRQTGKTIEARFSFTLGTTSSVTGAIVLQFPVQILATYPLTTNCGFASITDVSAGAAGRFSATCHVVSVAGGGVGTFAFGGSGGGQQANATNPMTWASTDVLSATLHYEGA